MEKVIAIINRKQQKITESQIKIFCPNCVEKARNSKKYLEDIVKEKSKFINSLVCEKEVEKYDAESEGLLIFKHFTCEDCGNKFGGAYFLRLEANLTLQQQYESAKNDDNMMFNTYRINVKKI